MRSFITAFVPLLNGDEKVRARPASFPSCRAGNIGAVTVGATARSAMRHVADAERRARLATRHALAPPARLGTPLDVATAMTALHATVPSTVYLSCRARTDAFEIADVDRALEDERVLVRQLAMRRTLFAFPRELIGAVLGSASARVEKTQRTRMTKDLVEAGVSDDGEAWLAKAREEVLAALGRHPDGLSATELRREVPGIAIKVAPTKGEPWSASRVLVWLGAAGAIVRGSNLGDWESSRPRWTLPRHWLGERIEPLDAAAGYRELVRRWLAGFGPGTEEDLVWWLGATKAAVRTALAELDAVAVSLDGGLEGWLLPDDLEEAPDPGPWVALLPVLDPTVMGWRDRRFYLGDHGAALFDTAGNAGTTAWADGRIVGCWTQDDAGTVQLELLDPVPAASRRALAEEASRLTEWLAGDRIALTIRSPAMRSLSP
jgi:hypothetical protein